MKEVSLCLQFLVLVCSGFFLPTALGGVDSAQSGRCAEDRSWNITAMASPECLPDGRKCVIFSPSSGLRATVLGPDVSTTIRESGELRVLSGGMAVLRYPGSDDVLRLPEGVVGLACDGVHLISPIRAYCEGTQRPDDASPCQIRVEPLIAMPVGTKFELVYSKNGAIGIMVEKGPVDITLSGEEYRILDEQAIIVDLASSSSNPAVEIWRGEAARAEFEAQMGDEAPERALSMHSSCSSLQGDLESPDLDFAVEAAKTLAETCPAKTTEWWLQHLKERVHGTSRPELEARLECIIEGGYCPASRFTLKAYPAPPSLNAPSGIDTSASSSLESVALESVALESVALESVAVETASLKSPSSLDRRDAVGHGRDRFVRHRHLRNRLGRSAK